MIFVLKLIKVGFLILFVKISHGGLINQKFDLVELMFGVIIFFLNLS